MEEKRKILVHKLLWGCILAEGVIGGFVAIVCGVFFVMLISAGVSFIAFIALFFALSRHCNTYEYKGKTILVYGGCMHHYLKYCGEKVDEYDALFLYSPVRLTYTLDDGTHIAAIISTSNRITLKINDKLYFNQACE